MSDPVAACPVLSTSIGYLTERNEIGAALVQYLLLSPGWTSDSHEEELVSFRTIASEVGDNPQAICSLLQEKVTKILNRYFPNDVIEANFTTEAYIDPELEYPREDSRYVVIFDITFITPEGNRVPAVLSGTFTVNKDESITVNFT